MKRSTWLAGAALLVLTVLAYLPSISSPFTHYDDPLYILNNQERYMLPGWAGLALQFDSTRAWTGGFVEFFPLRDSVYWALLQVFGLNPTPFHVTSLVFHVITTFLIWLLLTQLALSRRAAWVGAMLFALHPVHIESVVWIAGLKDPMYMMFMVGGLCAYASYRERQATWKYALMLGCLVAGFLVKSVIVVMPLIMLAMEVLLPPRAAWKEIAARLFGPFIIAGLFFKQITGIGQMNGVIVPPHHGSWTNHWVLVVWAQVKYLKQALFPTSYRLIYCFEPSQGLADWRLWVGLLILSAVPVLLWRWRHEPVRVFFILFYALAMAPVSNLVPFPAIMADRYLYAGSLATCALLAMLLDRVQRDRSFNVIAGAAAVLLTASTASRAWVWNDEELLWEEPDTDPACMTDYAFPAAQSHLLRCITTKDPYLALNALERTMAAPGVTKIGQDLVCSTLIGAATRARELGDADGQERAMHWARMATRQCPTDPLAWNAAMFVTLHTRPAVAHAAAVRSWRLAKTADAEVLVWLTALELNDPKAVEEINRIANLKDRAACEKVLLFANDSPKLGPLFGEAVTVCNDYLTQLYTDEGMLPAPGAATSPSATSAP